LLFYGSIIVLSDKEFLMATNIYPTLQEILDAQTSRREYIRYLPLARYVLYPIGYLITWLAIRIGLTSEAVSWLSGLVGLMAYLCLLSSYEQLLPVGIALLCFFNLLDCADGSIARTMKTENSYGRFLDSIMFWIDMGFWALIGIMAYRYSGLLYFSDPLGYGPIYWLAVGGLVNYFFLLLGFVEGTFDQSVRNEWDGIGTNNHKGLKDKAREESTKQAFHRKTPPFSVVRIICHNIRVRETHYFLLILAYLCNVIDLFLVFYLFYYFINTIALIIIYSNRGRQLLKFNKQGL
jgi:hypothetical protein